MEPYIIAFLFTMIIILLVIGGNSKLSLKIKSLTSGETFTAEKKKKSKGNSFIDWFYFDEDGKSIKDENLKKMIFEAFCEEDWYGAYEFYTKADSKVKEVKPTELV